jgi:hypothetical protein
MAGAAHQDDTSGSEEGGAPSPRAYPAGVHEGSAELLQGLTEALLRTIKSLATDLSARFPNDALVARMKKRIHLAADIWPQALIDGVGEGLYEYRDQIYSADAGFFLETSFEKERARINGDDVEKIAIADYVIPKVQEAWIVAPEEEKVAYAEVVQTLLDDYVEYLALQAGMPP